MRVIRLLKRAARLQGVAGVVCVVVAIAVLASWAWALLATGGVLLAAAAVEEFGPAGGDVD